MAVDTMARRRLDRQFDAIRHLRPEAIVPAAERHRLTLREVGPGGFLRWSGRLYRVEAAGTYQEADEHFAQAFGAPWTELSLLCVDTGETVYLEWEEDDAIEIHVTAGPVAMRDLRDDLGGRIDGDDLDTLVEEEDSLYLDGVEFAYDDDYAALYRRDGGEGEPVYLYEFVGPGGACLTIEEWQAPPGGGREDYQGWLSAPLHPDALEILVPRG